MLNSFKILRPVGNRITTNKYAANIAALFPHPAFFYQSGTAALAAAIVAACTQKPNIKNPEIIIPAYACPDLISAIVYAKATPVLIDLKEESPELSTRNLKDAISNNTVAIVAVRFFGITEQYSHILAITKQKDIIFIEDSAQGFPALDADNYWQGDLVILSFGRGKPINLLGGGAVLARNKDLIPALASPTSHAPSFSNTLKYNLKLFLYNLTIKPLLYGIIARLPGLKLGQTVYKKLDDIEPMNKSAQWLLNSNIEAYKTRISCQENIHAILQSINSEKLIDVPAKLNHNMSQPLLRYPILIKDKSLRDALYEKLKPYGASIMYQKPLYCIDTANQYIKEDIKKCPNASRLAEQLITLPTHEDINKRLLNIFEGALKTL